MINATMGPRQLSFLGARDDTTMFVIPRVQVTSPPVPSKDCLVLAAPTSPTISCKKIVPPHSSTRLSPRSSKRLRAGLLNKLGIAPQDKLNDTAATEIKKVDSRLSVLGAAATNVLKEPLKGNNEPLPGKSSLTQKGFLGALGAFFTSASPSSSDLMMKILDDSSERSSFSSAPSTTTESTSSTATSAGGRRRSLTFDEEVHIVSIPRRDQYSNRMQQHLWHPAEDLQANIMRNTVEFAADGWKWQQVREEEDHFDCAGNGELIHPVHVEIARLIRHEQGLPEGVPVATPFLKDMAL